MVILCTCLRYKVKTIIKCSMEFNCREHPGQVYLFYCTNHDVPCCSECKRVSHQPTCEMEIMDPHTNEVDFGLKMANILKRMTATGALLDELYKEFYQSRKHLRKQKDQFERDLRHFRQQIDAHIDEVETGIRDHFMDMYTKEMDNAKQRETGVLSKKDAVSLMVTDLEDMAKKETSLQSFIYLSKINSYFSVIEKHTSKIEKKVEYVTLAFSVSNDFLDFLKGLKMAHTYIKRTVTAQNPQPKIEFLSAPQQKVSARYDAILQKVGEFSIVKDTDFHSMSDMTVLDNGEIVVTNLNNRRLTIYDQFGMSNIEMELSHNPLYVTNMEGALVAMTLAHERKIIVLDVKKRKVFKQIKFDDECHGIAFTNGQLVINGKYKGLFILNSNFIIENILPDITGQLILCGRNNGTIIYGAMLYKDVFCVDIRGIRLFSITPPGLEYLNGISVNDKDEIFISGFLSNTVHKIDSDGKQSSIILNKVNGINLPRSVCCDKSSQSILVINNDGQCIETYNFKSK